MPSRMSWRKRAWRAAIPRGEVCCWENADVLDCVCVTLGPPKEYPGIERKKRNQGQYRKSRDITTLASYQKVNFFWFIVYNYRKFVKSSLETKGVKREAALDEEVVHLL